MNNKKTAVLVSGEFREFELAHKTWSFLNYIDYDMYFSTWNITEEMNELLGIYVHEEVTSERILKYFPNAIIDIRDDYTSLTSPSNKMLFHWRNAFNMMTFSGIEYDSVILIRPDLYLKEFKSINILLNDLEEDRIYGLSEITIMPPPMYLFVQDCLFIGKPEKLKWSLLTFRPPDVSFKDIHYHLGIHFLTNLIYVESTQYNFFEYYIMRSINKNFMDKSFELQKQLSEEWYRAKHNKIEPVEYYKLINKDK
jgi:hypothetical protein